MKNYLPSNIRNYRLNIIFGICALRVEKEEFYAFPHAIILEKLKTGNISERELVLTYVEQLILRK